MAEDGTTWLCVAVVPERWEQLEPGLSLEEQQRARIVERAVRGRLLLALRVWERANAAAPWVKTEGHAIRPHDPPTTFVELVARAIMTDCIAETCDGSPLGIAEHTARQVSNMVGPTQARRITNMLHRMTIASRTELVAR